MFGRNKRIVIVGRGNGWEKHRNYRFTHEVWCCFSALEVIQSKVDLAFGLDPLEIFKKTDTVEQRNYALMYLIVKDEVNRRKIPIFLPHIYKDINKR